MKILILGDSFSDPTWASNDYKAWPELLETNHKITNLSVCGSSLWWAYTQFLKNKDQYDYTVFVITVPNRVYIEHDNLHLNINTKTTFAHTTLENIYYRFFYSEPKEQFFHNSIVDDIMKNEKILIVPAFAESVATYNGISLCHFSDMEANFYKKDLPIFNDTRRKCHLSKKSNDIVYQKIINAIDNTDKILYLSEKDFVSPAEPITYYWK